MSFQSEVPKGQAKMRGRVQKVEILSELSSNLIKYTLTLFILMSTHKSLGKDKNNFFLFHFSLFWGFVSKLISCVFKSTSTGPAVWPSG